MSEDLRDQKAAEERFAAEPTERVAARDEDPEVKGHRFAAEPTERVAARDEEPEVEGHRFAAGPERVSSDPSRVSGTARQA